MYQVKTKGYSGNQIVRVQAKEYKSLAVANLIASVNSQPTFTESHTMTTVTNGHDINVTTQKTNPYYQPIKKELFKPKKLH